MPTKLIASLLLLLTGCGRTKSPEPGPVEICSASTPSPVRHIKLADISKKRLADSAFFTTQGYVYFAFEESEISVKKKRKGDYTSDYWIDFNDSLSKRWPEIQKLSGRKVEITGRINYESKGHLGYYIATIDGISCIRTVE